MDLIIRDGTVVTASEVYQADVGVEAGKVIGDNGKVLGQAGRGKLLKRARFTEM